MSRSSSQGFVIAAPSNVIEAEPFFDRYRFWHGKFWTAISDEAKVFETADEAQRYMDNYNDERYPAHFGDAKIIPNN